MLVPLSNLNVLFASGMYNTDRISSSCLVYLKAFWYSSVLWNLFLSSPFSKLVWKAFQDLYIVMPKSWLYHKMNCTFSLILIVAHWWLYHIFSYWCVRQFTIFQHQCETQICQIVHKKWYFWGEIFNPNFIKAVEWFAKLLKCCFCSEKIRFSSKMI